MSRAAFVVPGALLAALLALSSGCGRSGPPSVVLVSVDTLRADALGAYGSPLRTPHFDQLASEGVLFEHAFAPAPATAPSHATLLTGQAIQRHGVLRNGDALAEGAPTLAAAFRAHGYATAGFVSSFVLDPRFGWSQGFEHFDAVLPEQGATLNKEHPYPGAFWAPDRFGGFDRRATATTDAAMEWLAHAPKPFFLFVHYFDPHAPYVPPPLFAKRAAALHPSLEHRDVPGVAPERLRQLIQRYHGEVLYVDDALGALLDAVGRAAPSNTLVVVTGDHGEGLGQHAWIEHARNLYDEEIAVPLILRWPGHLPAGRRIAAQVGLVDVTPTILALAGIDAPAPRDGRSLADAARGGAEPAPLPIFGMRRLVDESAGWGHGILLSIRTPRWKYVFASEGPAELYDLAADPLELTNAFAAHPDVVAELRGQLEEHLAALPRVHDSKPISDDTRRALRALGYAE